MRQRGRKTSTRTQAEGGASGPAGSNVVPLANFPKPPSRLGADAKKIWNEVVKSKPADWFGVDTLPLLEDYCQRIVRGRTLAAALGNLTADDLTNSDGIAKYQKLTGLAEKETRTAVALARTMRLTQQAQIRPEKAGREGQPPAGEAAPPWRDD